MGESDEQDPGAHGLETGSIERVIDLCIEARERLDAGGSTRLRILIDILLLELARELTRRTKADGV